MMIIISSQGDDSAQLNHESLRYGHIPLLR
jgi:hypothetical protein